MRTELWKFYDKKGNNLNLYPDSYLNLNFISDVGTDAKGFAITDPTSQIVRSYIIDSGHGYDSNTSVKLDYTFSTDGNLINIDTSVFYKDVSVFNPDPTNSLGIKSVTIDNSTNWIYPSVTYGGAIFLDPVSKGLIETEHITILQESSVGYISPYDSSYGTIVLKMLGDEDVIKFFTLDEFTQEITWANELIVDVSTYTKRSGLQVNIGFRSDEEGVFERRMILYHRVNSIDYPLVELLVNAQSIGKDQRYDTLMDNLGLYKPESIPKLFKEVDINEDLPDWKILNYKAKHLILEHDQIMPFIGTYKGLINAIKWLGYEDIQVKEWFKDVKENKKLSLYVPYDADGRKKTIKYFSVDERRNLKKLNQLSLVYCITRETGEIDDWGNPITENCYEYNLNEILIKLYALKNWLEKNIIGVNARIYDLTGEGVYFERFQNFLYGTQNLGSVANYMQSLTPKALTDNSELISGDASIFLTLKEYDEITIEDLPFTLRELARYGWDPSNGFFSPEDYEKLSYTDPSAVFIGTPFSAPFADLYDLQWKLSVDKETAGVVTTDFVTHPLFVYDNQIRFYNYFDTSSRFLDVSANVDVTIESGYLRDPSIDIWEDSIAYEIYVEYDASGNRTGKWIFESSTGSIWETWGFSLQTDTSASLTYAYDLNYKAPLFVIKNYKWTDSSGISHTLDRDYYLDITDGKIAMDSSTTAFNGDTITIENFINFNYDTSLDEQKISLIVTYSSPRMPVFSYDPSDASTLYYNGGDASSIVLAEDNSIYKFNVNHAGSYEIEIYGWNGQNNLFFNFDRDGYDVFQKTPTINAYIDTSCAGNVIYSCVSTYLIDTDISALIDKYPIFDRIVPLYGLTLEYDVNDKPYINVPSITYFQDLPSPGNLTRFYNLTERITNISGLNITVDEDYQRFYLGDSVNMVQFDKGQYSFIQEASAIITSAASPNFSIDVSPSGFVNDSSTEWYLINNTERIVSNGVNDFILQTFTCDISNYKFRENQLVSILIEDVSGNKWGSSLRVVDVSIIDTANGYNHVLEGNVPQFILDASSNYSLTAKHGFSTFVDYQISISKSKEENNNFELYLNDTYYHQYYLDNTFAFLSIDFDHDTVLEQWYDPSTDGSLSPTYYPFDHSIELDVSTLVILRAEYDSSNYMLNQKNIWTIWNHGTNTLLMRVFNNNVSYIFDQEGEYDVQVESYDSYGNLKSKLFEGLIKVS